MQRVIDVEGRKVLRLLRHGTNCTTSDRCEIHPNSMKFHEIARWVWVNTYKNTIFSGLFTSINPSYFDVNKKGVLLVLTHPQIALAQPIHPSFSPPLGGQL